MKVFINGGHAPGIDPGVVGTQTTEAELCCTFMHEVSDSLLAAGCEVRFMQDDDLGKIVQSAADFAADVFVAIHCNGFSNPEAKGTETFCYSLSAAGGTLANCIQTQILNTLHTVDRGVKENTTFFVLRKTTCPAVLVETAFLSNEADQELLIDAGPEFSKAIARGITDYALLTGSN